MPAGRPTKYNAEIQAAADDYVAGGFERAGDCVPSVAGMACELDVTRAALYRWAESNEDFRYTLDKCLQIQERIALSGGMRGEFNAAITKLLLANHGYSERQALEHTGAGGTPLDLKVSFED